VFRHYFERELPGYKLRWLRLSLARADGYYPRIIDDFRYKMKAMCGGKYYDFWVTEVQPLRKEKYGDSVLHWHLMFACPKGVDTSYKKIQSYWSHGQIWIQPCDLKVMGYMLKYITEDAREELGFKYRKHGGTRLPSWYWLNEGEYEQALKDAHGDADIVKALSWDRGKGYAVFNAQDERRGKKRLVINVGFNRYFKEVKNANGDDFDGVPAEDAEIELVGA
jgi:hypothetical protein